METIQRTELRWKSSFAKLHIIEIVIKLHSLTHQKSGFLCLTPVVWQKILISVADSFVFAIFVVVVVICIFLWIFTLFVFVLDLFVFLVADFFAPPLGYCVFLLFLLWLSSDIFFVGVGSGGVVCGRTFRRAPDSWIDYYSSSSLFETQRCQIFAIQ